MNTLTKKLAEVNSLKEIRDSDLVSLIDMIVDVAIIPTGGLEYADNNIFSQGVEEHKLEVCLCLLKSFYAFRNVLLNYTLFLNQTKEKVFSMGLDPKRTMGGLLWVNSATSVKQEN